MVSRWNLSWLLSWMASSTCLMLLSGWLLALFYAAWVGVRRRRAPATWWRDENISR